MGRYAGVLGQGQTGRYAGLLDQGYGAWEDVTPLVQRRRKPDGSYETRPNPSAIPGGKPAAAPAPVEKIPHPLNALDPQSGIRRAASGVRLGMVEGADFFANLPELVARGVASPLFALDEARETAEAAARRREALAFGEEGPLPAVRPAAKMPGPAGLSLYGLPEIVDDTLQSARDEREALQDAVQERAIRSGSSPIGATVASELPRAVGNFLDPTMLLGARKPPGTPAVADDVSRLAGAALDPEEAAEAAFQARRAKALRELPGTDDAFVQPGAVADAFRPESEILGVGKQASREAQDAALGLRGGEVDDLARTALDEAFGPPAPPRPFDDLADDALRDLGITPASEQPALPRTQAPEPISPPLEELGPLAPARLEDAASTTSLKNAVTAEERAARGLPEVEITARRTLGEDWARAEARLAEDSGYGRRLAEDVAAKPRTLSSEENAILLRDRMRLTQEHRAALEAEEAALQAGDQAAIADVKLRRAGIEAALNVNDEAARRAGYEWGAAGNARQLLIREDYSPARLIQRAKVEAGTDPRAQKLLPQVQEKVTRLGQEIDAALAAEADVAARVVDRQAQAAIRAMAKDAAYETRKARRIVTRETLDTDFTALSREFGKKAATPRTGLDPELALLIGKMAKNRVQAGVVELEALVDTVYQAVRPFVEGITAREVRDAISGYGKTSQPSKDQIAAQLRELKAQGRLVSALEDAESGVRPLKSGFQRGEESAKVRALRQRVTEAMKTHGIGPTVDPAEQMRSALDAAKTRLRRQIEEMTKRLETGAPPRTKTPLAYDQEALSLKAERDRLKAALDEIDGRQGLTDAQRLKIAEGATERSIQDLEARLAAGDIAPRARTSSSWSPRLAELKKRQGELRQQLQDLRDAAKPPADPEAARLKALKTRLAKREEELRAQLASGDFSKKPRRAPVKEDGEALAARARVNALKAQADQEIAKLRLAQRSGLDKAIDWTVGWGRALKLTSTATVSKLTASGITKTFLIRPIEEVLTVPLTKLPGEAGRLFRERAPIQGAADFDAIAKSWAKFFSKDVRSAMWGHLRRMEQDPLTLAYGKPVEYFSEGRAPRIFDYPGHVHAALEDVPVKYSAFEYAVRKQAKFRQAMEDQARALLKEGENLSDPIVQLNAEARAFEFATREVFMQSNPLVRGFRRIVDRKPDDPVLLKLVKGFTETQLPIVTVPSNMAAERLDYLLGLPRGGFALYRAIQSGVDNLPYEQGDVIARQLKKGLFGLGLAWLGIAQADNIGGYFTGRRPRGNEPHEGEIDLFGVPIPKSIAEGPAVAQLHYFATVEKMRQRYREDGTGRGVVTATGSEIRNLPFLEAPADLMTALTQNQGDRWPKYAGSWLKGMTLPPDVQRTARIMDQRGDPDAADIILQQLGLKYIDARKRRPDTTFEEWLTGVPGQRDNVR